MRANSVAKKVPQNNGGGVNPAAQELPETMQSELPVEGARQAQAVPNSVSGADEGQIGHYNEERFRAHLPLAASSPVSEELPPQEEGDLTDGPESDPSRTHGQQAVPRLPNDAIWYVSQFLSSEDRLPVRQASRELNEISRLAYTGAIGFDFLRDLTSSASELRTALELYPNARSIVLEGGLEIDNLDDFASLDLSKIEYVDLRDFGDPEIFSSHSPAATARIAGTAQLILSCPNLRKLRSDDSGSQWTEQLFRLFQAPHHTTLTEVEVGRLDDHGLRGLGAATPHLEDLTLSLAHDSGAALAHLLSGCKKLKHLSLFADGERGFDTNTFQALRTAAPRLESLRLRMPMGWNPPTGDPRFPLMAEVIRNCTNLERLELIGEFNSEVYGSLAQLQRLQILTVSFHPDVREPLAALAPRLTQLLTVDASPHWRFRERAWP